MRETAPTLITMCEILSEDDETLWLSEIDHATEYALGQPGYASLKEKQRGADRFREGQRHVRIAPDGVRNVSLLLSSVSGVF